MAKLLIILPALLFACQPAPMHPDDPYHADPANTGTYEIYKGDTCNRVDSKGRRQGKWFSFSEGKIKDTLYYRDGNTIDK